MSLIPVDRDGQPLNPAFNYYRNRQKALLSLRGILMGIFADSVITDDERLFLDTWMTENETLFQNKLLFEIRRKVEKLFGIPTVSSKDAMAVIEPIDYLIAWEEKLQANFGPESMHEVLIGICRGIDADRKLTNDEVSSLGAFLAACRPCDRQSC